MPFLDEKMNNRYDLFWSLSSISKHPDWRILRQLAIKALCRLGLYSKPLSKPLKIERLVEVEGLFLSKLENDKLRKLKNKALIINGGKVN